MIKWICFDVDDTLLDFHAREKIAFFSAMQEMGVRAKEQDYHEYARINDALWKQLEKGEIQKERLRIQRFEMFFQLFYPTLDPVKMNDIYVRHLAEQCFLIKGVQEVVEKCSKRVHCAIATNGIASVQRRRLEKSGLMPYFKELFISEELDCSKPQKEFFDAIVIKCKCSPEEILFVGDSLSADIQGAVMNHFVSVWYNPKHIKNEMDIHADHEIDQLEEVLNILEEEKNENVCNF